MKVRGVLFAMKEAVEAEIDRMEEDRILKSVPYSEWVSPRFIVLNQMGLLQVVQSKNVQ